MNGYFRLITESGKTSIRLIPATGNGKPLDINDVTEYLAMKGYLYNLPALKEGIAQATEKSVVVVISHEMHLAERECYKLTVSPDKMKAYIKFFAASEGGENMTEQELYADLEAYGIKVGIKKETVRNYFAKREYCEEFLIAEGIEPKQGQNARIEYNFTVDRKARPTLKEDGSVDFFHLNVLNLCRKGDVLAKRYPQVPGIPGSDLYGETIRPAEVKDEPFRYGNNIELSEDGTTLTSMVDGHVELVEGRIFVSDMLVIENVDNSTGDIEYEGTVQINGNVCTNFSVKSHGDIIVNGVVEGARLESDGNIIIARGMNGMERGVLQAKGNIVVKYLENVTAQADGYIAAESILHSNVMAGTEVVVDGKRGFIAGGKVSATTLIDVRMLGSEMGTNTIVEVGTDPKLKLRITELQKQIAEDTKSLQAMQPVLLSVKQKIMKGTKFTKEQFQYVQSLAQASKQKTHAVQTAQAELQELQERVSGGDNMKVIVKGTVYPGVKICIGDASMVIQKSAQYCRFVKDRGDVKLTGI